MDEMEIFDAVAKKTGVRVKGDAPAFHWTTYRGGGVLARLYLPDGDGLAPFLRECARGGVFPFLLGGGSRRPYAAAFCAAALFGAAGRLDGVWLISDILNALMAAPNMAAVLALSGVVRGETRRYFQKRSPEGR